MRKTLLALVAVFLASALAAHAVEINDLFGPQAPLVVVGEEAHADDLLGGMRIMGAVQGVIGRQQAVIYERASFSTPADLLEYNEPLGKVREAFTSNDLPRFLASGVFRSKEHETRYNQYLRFNDSNATENNRVSGSVIYGEDDLTKKTGSYLYWNSRAPILEWILEFEEGVESTIEDNALESLEGRKLKLLGEEFIIADTIVNTSRDSLELKLMAGVEPFVVHENDELVATIGPREYDLEVLGISETAPEPAVKFRINGEITRELTEGDIDTLNDGTVIGITSILTTRKDIQGSFVQGYLGARMLRLTDENITDEVFTTSGVEVNGNALSTSSLRLRGSFLPNNKLLLRDITYRLLAWKNVTDLYVPKGDGLKAWLPEPEAMLTDRWDLVYAGNTLFRAESLRVTPAQFMPIMWDPGVEHTYNINFTSQDGYQYEFGHVTNEIGVFSFGEEDNALHFKEPSNSSLFPIKLRDHFVLSDASVAQADDTARTHVFEYSSFDSTSMTATFVDLGFLPGKDRETRQSSVDSTGRGTLVSGGKSYVFFVNLTSHDLSFDLNQNGIIQEGDEAVIATKGNALIDLGDYNTSGMNYTTVLGSTLTNVTVITLAKRFKDPKTDENLTFSLEPRSGNKVGIPAFPNMTGGTGYFSGRNTNPDKPETELATTGYGIKIEFYNPGENEPERLTLNYPFVAERISRSTQTGHQVIIAATIPTAFNASAFVGSYLVLDRTALNLTQPLITIGGPCANMFTAKVLNIPKDQCTKGFTAGKPMIKLVEYQKQPVLILAGLTKEDTAAAVQSMFEELVQLELEQVE